MVINRKSLRARINGAIQGNSRDYCGSLEIVTRSQTKPAMRQQIQDTNYVESDGGKLSRLGNRMFLKLTLPLLCARAKYNILLSVVFVKNCDSPEFVCYNIFTIYTEIKKPVIKVSIASHLWWEFFSSFFMDTPRWRLLFFLFPRLHGKLCCHSLGRESFLSVASSCRSSFSLEKWRKLCKCSNA